jgi:hypothetical protein
MSGSCSTCLATLGLAYSIAAWTSMESGRYGHIRTRAYEHARVCIPWYESKMVEPPLAEAKKGWSDLASSSFGESREHPARCGCLALPGTTVPAERYRLVAAIRHSGALDTERIIMRRGLAVARLTARALLCVSPMLRVLLP